MPAFPRRNSDRTRPRVARPLRGLTRRRPLVLASAGLSAGAGLTAVLTSTATATRAATPAAGYQPFSATPCLFPSPSNLYTVPDGTSATGLRVHLPPLAVRVSDKGKGVSAAPYARSDGLSPGSALILHFPGLDNPTAFAKPGA